MACRLGDLAERGGEGGVELLGPAPARQMNQLDVEAVPVDQRADGRPVAAAGDQVALRKTVRGPGGSGVAEVALRCGR